MNAREAHAVYGWEDVTKIKTLSESKVSDNNLTRERNANAPSERFIRG